MQRKTQKNKHSSQNIKTLFEFIQKNTALKNKMTNDYYAMHQDKIDTMYGEIMRGNHQAEIFDHHDAMVFTLHLIKSKQISLLQGMTVYAYLMAKGQYCKDRSKTTIKYDDYQGENTIISEIVELEDGACLSHFGERYITHLCKQFTRIDKSQLRAKIKNFAESDKWLIKLDYDYQDIIKHKDDALHRSSEMLIFILASQNNGFFFHERRHNRAQAYIPSFSLIQYILDQQFENPMQLRFGFGRVGVKTLYKMHKKNRHPVPLYSPDVKSNLMSVHGYECGGFLAMMHDIGHTLWASRLLYDDRQYALKTVIPALNKLKRINDRYQLDVSGYHQEYHRSNLIRSFIRAINDFNLVDFKGQVSLDIYLDEVMFSAVHEQSAEEIRNTGLNIIGSSIADKFYFLIKITLQEMKELDLAQRSFLEDALNKLHIRDHPRLQSCLSLLSMIFTTPEQADYNKLSDRQKAKLQNCNISHWYNLFARYTADKDLWEKISASRGLYIEYKTLCMHMGLKFYPGVFPITQDKRVKYQTFFQMLLQNKQDSMNKRPLLGAFDRELYKKPRLAEPIKLPSLGFKK